MKTRFNVHFMDEALDFLNRLDHKSRLKVAFIIQGAKRTQDPKILKKLTHHIYEFRIRYYKSQIRFFAFWSPFEKSMIICTHGIYKKSQRTPQQEIHKAERIRDAFIKSRQNEKE